MCFDYTGVTDLSDPYKYKCSDSTCYKTPKLNCSNEFACETFQDCPGSINIKGNYLIAIYSHYVPSQQNLYSGNNLFCQTFIKSVENLNGQEITIPGGKKIAGVLIFATK